MSFKLGFLSPNKDKTLAFKNQLQKIGFVLVCYFLLYICHYEQQDFIMTNAMTAPARSEAWSFLIDVP